MIPILSLAEKVFGVKCVGEIPLRSVAGGHNEETTSSSPTANIKTASEQEAAQKL